MIELGPETGIMQPEQAMDSLETKLRSLSFEERQEIKQEALSKYNHMEALVHTINRIDSSELQDTLF